MATIGKLTIDIEARTKRLEDGVERVNRKLRQMDRRSRKSKDALSRLTKGAVTAAAAIYGMRKAAEAAMVIFEATERRNGLEFAMRAATGSAAEAQRQLGFVAQEAERLGLNFNVAAQSFKGLTASAKGTKLAGEGVQNIFTAVAEASAVMRLSNDQTEGSLLAISQIMSKGTVQAEELRGQLGERLPGAFQIAARAMGVTTKELGKMLEQGEVIADDFLPRFAIELQKSVKGGVADAAKSATASFNRLANAWDRFLVALGRSGVVDVLQEMADAATLILKAIGPVEVKLMSMTDVGVSNLELLNNAWHEQELSIKRLEQVLKNKDLLNPQAIIILEDRLELTRAKAEELWREIVKASKKIQKMADDSIKPIQRLDTSFQEAADSMSMAMDLIEQQFARLDKAEANNIAFDTSDITKLEQSLQTAEDRIRSSYERRAQIVDTAFQNELISESRRFELLQKLHAENQHRLTEIYERGYTDRQKFTKKSWSDQARMIFGELENITSGVDRHNKALFNINKAAAISNAIINTYEGVTKTLAKYPQPIAGILAATHLAAGIAQVNAIRNTSFGSASASSGGLGGGGGGGSVSEPPEQPEPVRPPRRGEVIVHGVDPDKMFSGQQIRDLWERLKEVEANDVSFA